MTTLTARDAIVINDGNLDRVLSDDDALLLTQQLNELFGLDEIIEQHIRHNGPWSSGQRSKLFGLWGETFPDGDADDRHTWASSVLGREVTSWRELSFEDASRIIDTLHVARQMQMAFAVQLQKVNNHLAVLPKPGPTTAEQAVLDAAKAWQDVYMGGSLNDYKNDQAGASARIALSQAVQALA